MKYANKETDVQMFHYVVANAGKYNQRMEFIYWYVEKDNYGVQDYYV
jgi:hypothetical protein